MSMHATTADVIPIYGYAKNEAGKVAQTLAHHERGKPTRMQFTGKTYRNHREAAADSARLNTETAKRRGSLMVAGDPNLDPFARV